MEEKWSSRFVVEEMIYGLPIIENALPRFTKPSPNFFSPELELHVARTTRDGHFFKLKISKYEIVSDSLGFSWLRENPR
jgi:hypothetical protein